jgi:hypothetical protein
MGAKRAGMKKRTVTHIQVKIVMKRRNQTYSRPAKVAKSASKESLMATLC